MNSSFLLYALGSAILGACPALFSKRYITFGVMAVIYFFLSWWFYYGGLPCLDYSLLGWASVWTCILAIVTAFISLGGDEGNFSVLSFVPGGGYGVVLIFLMFSGCGACNTEKYSALIGDINQGKEFKHWTQQNQELSPTHIRIVPIEHAVSIGQSALNQHADEKGNNVGSQFHVDENYVTLQKVNGELVYVEPLDYVSWGSATSGALGVPGYVLVNAEDQHTKPRYINKHLMRYTPGAYWDMNLERHIYTHGYENKILIDFSFELDDSLNDFWVVTTCHHTIGVFSGLVVDGILIIDPYSGVITPYDMNHIPKWVDRVIPADIVNQNINYWGSYLNGFRNGIAGGARVGLRKAETTVLNYGSDGDCWYVTPVTSINNNSKKDENGKNVSGTMTDLIYTNSRTGISHRYSTSGFTEEALLATVDNTFLVQKWHGACVVYENVADRLTAIVPILSGDHAIKGLALVDVETKSMSWDPDPVTALMKYQTSLGSLGSAIGTDIATVERVYKGAVNRICQSSNSSGNIYFLYFKGLPSNIFSVTQTYHEILLTQPGDSVLIKYNDGKMDIIGVTFFDNLSLNIQASENQKNVTDRVQKRREDERLDASRGSVKNTISNGDLSNDVLDSVAKKLGTPKK